MQTTTLPFSRFLQVANEACRIATPEQRGLLRLVALRRLTVEQRIEEIEKIMGWA